MKTKIVATIGPACNTPEKLSQLIDAGVRIVRLNFSHGTAADFSATIKTIRDLEVKHGIPITVMQDLSGPKIRIGAIEEGSLSFSKGDLAFLGPERPQRSDMQYIPFDKKELLDGMESGDRIVLADGTLQFLVDSRVSGGVVMEADNSGIVTSRKGLALPGKHIMLPALTDKDKKDLLDGLALGADAVALSFVQTPEDVLEARSMIKKAGYAIPICVKLERKNAVDRLEDILAVADIVMVARGDLGIECPMPTLPTMQKRIIAACNNANKPVIVATQMLLSMVNNPIPTRAETTDVANAVLDGTDCVMLSEETAMGRFPVEAVSFMSAITAEAEALLLERTHLSRYHMPDTAADFFSYSACLLAERRNAKAIVAHSMSGAAARSLSSQRPRQPVYGLTPDPKMLRHLNFSWGVLPRTADASLPGHLERAERFIDACPELDKGDLCVITAGQFRKDQVSSGTNLVKMYTK
ncbi:MAG: pyruvate kinase [Desulfovibrio sp.]|jgi:pyruvate kinase|nr:pyruvate kinase [Desulfovibrio sp.]